MGEDAAEDKIWVVLQIRIPFGVVVLREPYYFGNLKKGPQFRDHLHSGKDRSEASSF